MLIKKSLVSLSVAAAIVLTGFNVSEVSANPGKQVWDSLRNDGVSTHTTRARSFESRYGRHWTGGQASIRIRQTRARNIVNFAPPGLDYGCSGIDLYAGSFSLLSGDEIVQMYRGAMSGAASYFFGLSVQSLCPACFSIAEGIKDDLQKFNELMRVDCQRIVSSDFGQSVSRGIQETAVAIRDSASRRSGFSDGTDGIRGESQTPRNTAPDILRMVNANIVVDLVEHLSSTAGGSFAGYMKEMASLTNASASLDGVIPDENLQGAAIMLMSIMGTHYIKAIEDEAECDALISAGSDCLTTNRVSPTLTFSDLAFGIDGRYSLNGCKAGVPDCTEVVPYEITQDMQGLLDFTKELIAGSGSDFGLLELLHQAATRTTIESSANGENILMLIDNFSYPWMNLALATRGRNGYSIDTIAQLVSLNVTYSYMYELKRDLDKILTMRRENPIGVNFDQQFRELRAELDASFNAFEANINAKYQDLTSNLQLNAQLRDILKGAI